MQDAAAAAVSAALGKLLTSLLLIGVRILFYFILFFVENDLENLQPKCTNNTDCFQEGEEEALIT